MSVANALYYTSIAFSIIYSTVTLFQNYFRLLSYRWGKALLSERVPALWWYPFWSSSASLSYWSSAANLVPCHTGRCGLWSTGNSTRGPPGMWEHQCILTRNTFIWLIGSFERTKYMHKCHLHTTYKITFWANKQNNYRTCEQNTFWGLNQILSDYVSQRDMQCTSRPSCLTL